MDLWGTIWIQTIAVGVLEFLLWSLGNRKWNLFSKWVKLLYNNLTLGYNFLTLFPLHNLFYLSFACICLFLFFFFSVTGVWTQGFTLVKKGSPAWATTPVYFALVILPGWPWTAVLPISASQVANQFVLKNQWETGCSDMRPRQEDHKFEINLGYIIRPYLKK
jgi:hypothetical protein